MARASVPELVTQLAHDAIAVARAEVDLARAKLSAKVAAVRTGAILLVAAGLLAILGLIGLVVGCVLALAPLVGAFFAGLIVLGVTLLVAGVLALVGIKRLSADTQPTIDPHGKTVA